MNTKDIERATTCFKVVYFSKVFHYRLVRVGMFPLRATRLCDVFILHWNRRVISLLWSERGVFNSCG